MDAFAFGRSTRALVANVAGGMPYALHSELVRLVCAQFCIGSTKRSSSSSVSRLTPVVANRSGWLPAPDASAEGAGSDRSHACYARNCSRKSLVQSES
jgi:hypothetical protein